MEGDAVSATIGVLVQNLINVSKDEILLIRGLQDHAEELRVTFSTIQCYLDDAKTRSITEEAVNAWLKNLEAKTFEADNAFDELHYQLISKKVASCFPSFDRCVRRRDLALRINKIIASFESINKSATDLRLQEKLAVAPDAARDAALETDSITVDPIFIGRDRDVSEIVEMLTAPTEEVVSVLPIVGMGGLGKTTLVRNVFNHEKTKTRFGQHIWVHVSHNFDVMVLLKKILKTLEGGNVENESREDLLKTIQEALKDKTYLLVLDDVWNEDRLKWENFMNSWATITSTKGNYILVTTRKVEVGSIVKKALGMHVLNDLSEEECWSIIKERAFEKGAILSDFEDIGRSIAKTCQGLPLAANVLGGVLCGKSKDEWRSIEQDWLSNVGVEKDYITKILKLSFHHLPSPSLKKCFAYCSIYPKGALIDKEQMIGLWMAEGFLQPSKKCDMETVGNQFLKVFLQNSLLQVADRDEYGDIESYSMHDLVHDVASSILDGIYYKRDESSQIPKAQAKWLRTLIYNGRICDIVFSNFKSLHSLTLINEDIIEMPDSIKELIHLRYLDISFTCIRYLPNSIGKLSHLQTFRYLHPFWESGLKKLPSNFKHLFNLRHLYLSDEDTTLPPQLGMLTSLRTLPWFKVRNEEGHRIVELGSLEKLKGKLKIYNLEKVQGEEESKKAYLFKKSGLVKLVLRWGKSREVEINDENVLKGLQPHPNIKGLEIYGFKGASLPTWTLKMTVFFEGSWVGLSRLMEVRLHGCEECEEIPMFGHLPHLKILHLSELNKVKSLGASFYGIEECSSSHGVYKETISVFPALEMFKLWDMPNLREWEEVKSPASGVQVKMFPCLEYLEISGCNQLMSAPTQLTSLKELSIKVMDSELPLESICGIKLKTLTSLSIENIEGLISLPDWLFHNNQHLTILKICDCPELRELPDGLHGLNSLKELQLYGCYNIKSIPFSASGKKVHGLTSLQRLRISGCRVLVSFIGEMEELSAPLLEDLSIDAGPSDAWDCVSFNKSVDGILRFGSHSLRELHLKGMEDWESLPDQLQHLTALSRLYILCFGIEELPEWFGNLSSVQEIGLLYCSKLKHLPSVEAMRRLTNLTTLDIYDCPLLKEGCKRLSGSEWPKISHIRNVKLL